MSHRLLVLPLMITVLVFASLADIDAVVDGHRSPPTLDQIESGSLKEAESVLHHHHRHQRSSGNDDAEGLMATKVNTAAEEEDEEDDDDGDRYEDTWMARRALAHDPTRSNWEEFSAGYQVLLAICFLLLAIMFIFSLFWFRRSSSEGEDKRRQKQQQRQSPKNNNSSSSSSATASASRSSIAV